ncbi:uncharacterized protein N7479_008885 [Penicillium vulpinum]|uniref:uncharacterized protein n=1 Tax=Penicillium vulpinum TaxID=29845 RepID=UPI0025479BB4|nr:uncharacterized protein N7479_008885 [Penicillium vulpinum]KAJ5950472.1 hypothetical protein N7479_008885 [Penicillium vulpinum]
MYLIRPASSTINNPLIRTISSLVPGNILQGAQWNYRILNLVKGDSTHISTVFKAEVIPRDDSRNVPEGPQWAFIKGASPDDKIAMKNMDREIRTYSLPGVASSHCVILEDSKYVNTDYKSANILLSGTGSDSITAKVGDLGLVVPAGELLNAQPYAMRAPEVFLGEACAGPSQVWAVAAMLLCWIKTGVLGMWDSPHPLLNMPWSMAKIKRLFPNWKIPTPDEVNGHFLKASLNIAVNLGKCVPELQAILPFDKETKTMEMPNQLRDLLRFMLVHDPGKRPSASSVLASRELRAFENLMGA